MTSGLVRRPENRIEARGFGPFEYSVSIEPAANEFEAGAGADNRVAMIPGSFSRRMRSKFFQWPSPAFACGVIAAGVALAYSNTFRAPFVFDDIGSIVENSTIQKLWPPGGALSPPKNWGFTVSGRPILNFSFALNYAVSGLEVWSYHALNLLIHILAGWTLFGLVRRTLLRPPLAARFSVDATPLAFVVAAVWALHPLQTESVTYVVQRAESLMGFFFLLTLYAFVRSLESIRPRRWWVVSFGACLFAVGTKEVAVLAPIVVLLYDRTFVSGSFREAWRRHRGLQLALFATWVPLAWLVIGTGGDRGGTMGFSGAVSWSGYWLTQPEAILRYLRLAIWPHPLVFEYGKVASASSGAALMWAAPTAALAMATLFAWVRWPIAGFLGACFFGILAPTSLVPGMNQMIVEHRMYLPLAAVVAFGFGALALHLERRFFFSLGLALAVAAGVATWRRNIIYRDDQTLWEDTVAKRPNNARAQNNLGLIYYRKGRIDDAIVHYRDSLRLDPESAHAHYNLGLALMGAGQLAEAADAFREAIRILPYYFNAHLNRAVILVKLGRQEEAFAHFASAIEFDPAPAEAHFRYGVALAELGRLPEAIRHYEAALKINPGYAEAQSNWGVALFRMNAVSAAIEHFNAALRLKPDLADVHFNLGLALATSGRVSEAISHYAEAVRLNPDHSNAELNLGIALGQSARLPEAIQHLERAVLLRPDSFAAHTNLAIALAETPSGSAEAIFHYDAALRLRPDDPQAHYNLGFALLRAGRIGEARQHFERALELRPAFTPAGDILLQMRERGL